MFNFSANHLFLISRTEYPLYAVRLMPDPDTRLYEFSKAQLIRPGVAYCGAGKVKSADKLNLAIESVRLDTKSRRVSTPRVPRHGGRFRTAMIQMSSNPTSRTASIIAADHAPVCVGVLTGTDLGVKTGGVAAVLNRRQQFRGLLL